MRRLRLFLVLSLLGNLFGVGMLAGGVAVLWHRGTIPFGHAAIRLAGGSGRPLLDAGAALPGADRLRFADAMRDAAILNRPLRRDAVRQRRIAALLFGAPAFNRALVGEALDRARQDDFTLRQRLEDAMLDVAASLPAAERQALADGLARGGPLRHPGR